MASIRGTVISQDADPRLLEALDSLNRIGAAINRISPREAGSVAATLRLIVESAIKVVPGSSGVVYAYDAAARAFDLDSRVSAGEPDDYVPSDAPRPDGIGARAVEQQRRVLSHEEEDLDVHPDKVRAGASSMACFPLVVARQPVGVLYVYLHLHQERRFSQLELLMLEVFVNQAAMAIYQARRVASVRRDLARKEDELARLRRAGLLISSRPRLEETLEAILQMALEVTGARYGIFRLVDEPGDHLVMEAIAGEHLDRPLVDALPIDESSVMGWVATHRRAACIHDLKAAPWVRIYRPLDAELKMQSELAVPLIGAGGRLEGVLNLESPAVGGFGEEDSHLLQSLATQAVIAIQEVRLLDALQEVARLLLTLPCQEVLERLVELACTLLSGNASAVWLLEDERLVLHVASAGYERGDELPLDGSLTGRAILDRAPVRAEDVGSDPRFHRPDLARAQGWTRALIVPLAAGGRDDEPVGAFSVYSVGPEPAPFAGSEWDEKVLTFLAHFAALAVQNRAHQGALRRAEERHAVAETFAAVGDVAANVLHHLNNKVGAIPVRVQGIRDKCAPALEGDAYLAANLAEIERSAGEAMEAVRANLSHLYPIHPAPVDVAGCLAAAVEAAGLPDTVRVDDGGLDGLPPVMAGTRTLALVFTNLLENAAEAMQGKGRVVVAGSACDGRVEITVADDGPGIPEELRERVFEFHFGRDPARAGRLGFGLWWVRTLMVRLGGSIGVEGGPDGGTTFRLALPRAEEAE